MPKLKSHSGVKKRLRVTKTGKLMRRRAGGSHFLEKKSAARKRKLAGVEEFTGKAARDIRRRLNT